MTWEKGFLWNAFLGLYVWMVSLAKVEDGLFWLLWTRLPTRWHDQIKCFAQNFSIHHGVTRPIIRICSPHEKIIVLGTLMFGCSSFPCPSRTVTLTRTGLVCVCACDLLRETFRCLPPPCLGPVTGPMHHMHPQNNDSRAEVLQSQVPTKCSDPRRKTYTHCSGAGPSGQCPPRRTCRQVAWACLNSMPPVRLG